MNIERLQISAVTASDPVQKWPVFNQKGQAIQELSLNGWTIYDPNNKIGPTVIKRSGTIQSKCRFDWLDERC
jgi:hypothetical protein